MKQLDNLSIRKLNLKKNAPIKNIGTLSYCHIIEFSN